MLRIMKVEIDRPTKPQYVASANVSFSDGEGTHSRINCFCIGSRDGRLFVTSPAVSLRTPTGWSFRRLLEVDDDFWHEISAEILDTYEEHQRKHAGGSQ
jgi:hypothetical protein